MSGKNGRLAPKLINLGPDEYVERYDAGFAFPKMGSKSRQNRGIVD